MFVRRSLVSSSRLLSSAGSRSGSSLVVAEVQGNDVTQGTLATITAASKIKGNPITLLVAGSNVGAVATKASNIAGVSKVICVDDASLIGNVAEKLASTVVEIAKDGFTHVFVPASNNGKNFAPRAAALLDSSPLTDVLSVIDENTFTRPMYAGNAIATMKMTDKVKFLLVRPTSFEKAAATGGAGKVEAGKVGAAPAKSASWVSESQTKSERPDLGTARVVVSGGRGMKNGENFKLLETLADKLGGAVGASRAAVDAGFVPNDYQVGQTGKCVAPDLYIAVGISGAIQHLSGMKDSKVIVAVNKDKEAPIFQVSDYGVVDDLFKVVPELTSKL